MKLSRMIDQLKLKRITGDLEIDISQIEIDSRKIEPGGMFICITGFQQDGHQYAEEAIRNGAAAIMAERFIPGVPPEVSLVIVPDTRRALPIIANAFYDNPSCGLRLIGITGTNGKTTTAHMVEHLLNASGRNAGSVGTLSMTYKDIQEEAVNTTPDPLRLQKFLRTIANAGAEYAVVEVSSHGLDMGRVLGCGFQTAAFTNLAHDHLDYHHHMDEYRGSKELLFSRLGNSVDDMQKTAVLNGDDAASAYYAKRTAAQVVTYGLGEDCHLRGIQVERAEQGTRFTIQTYTGDQYPVVLKVPGLHNVYNALAAAAICSCEGLSWDEITRGLQSFTGISGRFEDVSTGQDFNITIDYAHNPEGLKAALLTARECTSGKIICVMGCRGERDRLKRPVMAGIAADLADGVVFTSDNVYSEQIEDIFLDMRQGLSEQHLSKSEFVANRQDAILQAIHSANAGDRILITGRGHEKFLYTSDGLQQMSDADIVQSHMVRV
ncbi:UDP-N-acetylmuramyl-tripeptide synthetase [Paenibacillus algicola]|uniref:UDP-N-acetylmuramyl-tripeptide synthetase n=1 Tax=Paenibacillus algicola TaxID=2565926 RepID=A0A4P8XK22_9BACL|nr:UDP-N-acetylmuramoyl-L-alanyl-D-glutamate--2,6-diaminopimelate ligase [Paenibacillus algicola]QCT03017.1 UDP-N-acetylmuramyl-tripeptide synthetase [Paenibacillus algicola]